MSSSDQEIPLFDQVATDVVELGNRIVSNQPDIEAWDVGSGLLAGAVHYWLFSRQPCEDPSCTECNEVNTAENRMRLLIEDIRRFAEESDYYHSPNDRNVGKA